MFFPICVDLVEGCLSIVILGGVEFDLVTFQTEWLGPSCAKNPTGITTNNNCGVNLSMLLVFAEAEDFMFS